jgi:NADH-quinone oxidoreductase subunit L
MVELTWLIPALPLAGFLFLLFLGKRLGEPTAGWFGTLMVAGSFVTTVIVWIGLRGDGGGEHHQFTQTLFTWLPAGGFSVDVGFLVDPLSITMCLFVTGIASLIHLYSIGYMHGDPRFSKFFVYLNLFVFSMLMLVLGDNLLLTFLGWEGVGTCSYLLISFWHEKDANASAGKKAFVTNRVGDWGFMVAMFLCFAALGSIKYADITAGAAGLATTTATGIAVLLFIGAVGKSAQLPLMVWLPDAMAGPTPVSALIHAATMVTAGVYLMTRVNPVLAAASPWVSTMIAIIGAVTALFAATIAVAQNDIKKVLAYSTVSQLGYMFLAVGSGVYVAAIFHMVTHAFFKALLFLGSGSVIHGMDDEQDMRKMGGLQKLMPITAFTFIFGWLAIAGVPPFAGFWSKDEILLSAWNKGGIGYVLWGIGLVTALLTAFYMSRQVFMTFYGEPRWKGAESHGDEAEQSAEEVADGSDAAEHGHGGEIHPHESPWTMTFPLIVLAGLSIIGGMLSIPIFERTKTLENWLHPVVAPGEVPITVATGVKIALAVIATIAAIAGIAAGYALYRRRRFEDQPVAPEILAQGWYYDSSITAFMGGPGRKGFDAVAWFDGSVVDGAVNGTARLVQLFGGVLRRLQTGYVRTYAMGVALGAIVVVAVITVRSAVL